jgi:transposase
MIPVPAGVRVWLAVGRTDMRKGMNGLALQVQQALGRDPHAGDLYVFRGGRGDLIKIIWHDGLGMSLYAKRLERGRFLWPSPADGTVAIFSRAARLYAGSGARAATDLRDGGVDKISKVARDRVRLPTFHACEFSRFPGSAKLAALTNGPASRPNLKLGTQWLRQVSTHLSHWASSLPILKADLRNQRRPCAHGGRSMAASPLLECGRSPRVSLCSEVCSGWISATPGGRSGRRQCARSGHSRPA